MRCALARRHCAARFELLFNCRHRGSEILVGAGPARRKDSRRAVEGIDHNAGIISKSRQFRCHRGGLRLDAGVVAKCRSSFLGLFEQQFTRRYGVDAVGCKQFAHLGEFSRIMRRDHQPARDATMLMVAHITAIFCKSTSLATPLRASASKAANCSSENGVFSAVAWISTILPEPVRTKLASVSAWESSA